MRDRQVAARRQGGTEPGHGLGRAGLVRQDVQHGQGEHGDRLAEVDQPANLRRFDDLVRTAQIRADGRGLAARQQRVSVADHHRVAVHVHHARFRSDKLRDLVHVLVGGQPRAEVKELRDAFAGQELHGPLEEVTVLPREPRELRDRGRQALGGFPVRREVVLAAEPVVVHPGNVRH
jgi:hypothetical protein